MKKLSLLALMAIVLTSSACQTIYFQNGPDNSTEVGDEQLYSLWLLGSIDSSGSVDLEKECSGRGWRRAKSELSILAGAIRLLTAPIYTPWGIAWKCEDR